LQKPRTQTQKFKKKKEKSQEIWVGKEKSVCAENCFFTAPLCCSSLPPRYTCQPAVLLFYRIFFLYIYIFFWSLGLVSLVPLPWFTLRIRRVASGGLGVRVCGCVCDCRWCAWCALNNNTQLLIVPNFLGPSGCRAEPPPFVLSPPFLASLAAVKLCIKNPKNPAQWRK